MQIKIKLDKRNIASLDYITMNKKINYKFITSITVPSSFKYEEVADRLLTIICDLADNNGLTLFTYIIPTSVPGYILRRIFTKYKFMVIRPKTMVRTTKEVDKAKLLMILEKYEMED